MGNAVLFATGLGKNVSRAENINAVYDAYNGRKKLMSTHDFCFDREARSGEYSLLVVDIFPTHHYMKTIMIWHSIQGGKYIGLDERRTYYKRAYADNIDCIVAAGYGGIEMFNRCTGVPKERIIDLGMPRTDRYKRKKKGSGGTALADKRSYLYVPTFRNLAETPLPCIDWQYIDTQLTDDELFVIKSHPYGCAVNAGQYKHIIEVPQM